MNRFLFATVVALTLPSAASADLTYQFSGGVTSSSDPSTIAVGETWMASFVIDPTTTGTNAPVLNAFDGAILSASIEFSGSGGTTGFTKTFNPAPAPARIRVGDGFAGFDFVDAAIGVAPANIGDTPTEESLYVSIFGDPMTFTGNSLPGVGTNLSGSMGMDLFYLDSDSVFQNVSFSGIGSFSAVPEPGSFGLIGLFATGLVCRRNRRRTSTRTPPHLMQRDVA
ncbi:MAG: PEP-CTERM sorting domain-containing protein [Planctomycetaceae bacterium]